MKKHLSAFALAATLAQPAAAVTFPSLTTIYVGSGVYDDGGGDNGGVATSIHCSNVSGVTVSVRALVLNFIGANFGSLTVNLAHGATVTFSTHLTSVFNDEDLGVTFGIKQGVVNVESTNSAVFCTAVVVDAANEPPTLMSPLHLVRVNPHPGTVE
jgi:hypothetical protein